MATPPPPSGSGGAEPAAAPKSSLAAWKVGADKMTTAEAGSHVASTVPKPRPKAAKAPKPAASGKPWHEQSVAERFGTQPPKMLPVNLNKQLKDVLRYLEALQDREVTWEEIITQGIPSWYDTSEAGDLFNLLTTNPLVDATSSGFRYKSLFGIRDKATLLAHIRSRPSGVRSIDFKDSYTTVLEDAAQLHAEGAVFRLYNAEFKMDVFFPAPAAVTSATPDLIDTYLKKELPPDPQELAAEVSKLGMRSALANSDRSNRKAISMLKAEKVKKKRKLNLRHVTNTHLAHLLVDNTYTSID